MPMRVGTLNTSIRIGRPSESWNGPSMLAGACPAPGAAPTRGSGEIGVGKSRHTTRCAAGLVGPSCWISVATACLVAASGSGGAPATGRTAKLSCCPVSDATATACRADSSAAGDDPGVRIRSARAIDGSRPVWSGMKPFRFTMTASVGHCALGFEPSHPPHRTLPFHPVAAEVGEDPVAAPGSIRYPCR
jgi:hypothetical protein